MAASLPALRQCGYRPEPPSSVLEAVTRASRSTLDDLRFDGADMGFTLLSLEAALISYWRAVDFESGLRHAVEAGGDTDTNGAIVGAVLGARFGLAAIPERWQRRVTRIRKGRVPTAEWRENHIRRNTARRRRGPGIAAGGRVPAARRPRRLAPPARRDGDPGPCRVGWHGDRHAREQRTGDARTPLTRSGRPACAWTARRGPSARRAQILADVERRQPGAPRRAVLPLRTAQLVELPEIAATVMPIIFGMLADVPEGTHPAAAPASAVTTFIVIAALALRATGVWRMWMPPIGLVAGCVVASHERGNRNPHYDTGIVKVRVEGDGRTGGMWRRHRRGLESIHALPMSRPKAVPALSKVGRRVRINCPPRVDPAGRRLPPGFRPRIRGRGTTDPTRMHPPASRRRARSGIGSARRGGRARGLPGPAA